MKKWLLTTLSLFPMITLLGISSLAQAQTQDQILAQRKSIEEFYNTVLPKPIEDSRYNVPVRIGHTPDGSECVISSNFSSITMVKHPDIGNSQEEDASFDWSLNMAVDYFGKSLHADPVLRISANSLVASATVPVDYGLARYGVKIQTSGNKVRVSIRNNRSLADKYSDCILTR